MLGAGAGLDNNVPDIGAGRQEQGGTSEATDSDPEGEGAVQQGVNDYLLANPRLAEAL